MILANNNSYQVIDDKTDKVKYTFSISKYGEHTYDVALLSDLMGMKVGNFFKRKNNYYEVYVHRKDSPHIVIKLDDEIFESLIKQNRQILYKYVYDKIFIYTYIDDKHVSLKNYVLDYNGYKNANNYIKLRDKLDYRICNFIKKDTKKEIIEKLKNGNLYPSYDNGKECKTIYINKNKFKDNITLLMVVEKLNKYINSFDYKTMYFKRLNKFSLVNFEGYIYSSQDIFTPYLKDTYFATVRGKCFSESDYDTRLDMIKAAVKYRNELYEKEGVKAFDLGDNDYGKR